MLSSVRRRFYRRLGYLLVAAISAAMVIFPLLDKDEPAYQLGQVVAQDLRAPYPLQYESDYLTRQQQDLQARAVAPVYTPPDPSIARQQVNRLRAALDYITAVRADAYATPEERLQDLAALQFVSPNTETSQALLSLSPAAWQVVQQESIRVLEQVLQRSVQETQVENTRRGLSALVSLSLPEEQADLIADLLSPFIVANSLYSEELTQAARMAAREHVEPVIRTFVAGETIVSRGSVLSELDIEALEAFGLTHPQSKPTQLWGGLAISVLMFTLVAGYLLHIGTEKRFQHGQPLLILGVLHLIFLAITRWVVYAGGIWPYLFPVSAFGMSVAAILDSRLALFAILPLVILAPYGTHDNLLLTIFYLASSIGGIVNLYPARRMAFFVRAGLFSGLSGIVAILAMTLSSTTEPVLTDLPSLILAALFHGTLSAALTLLLQFILAPLIGETTEIQLMELAQPDHPLLQYLLRQAPGTYQHSLQVANLAEQAAERVNANAFLTRVGALYHDIGKTLNPAYFIENQMPGSLNPHDDLTPEASAAIIIRHVTDGVDLAHKYHLPRRIQDFILEHHGNSLAHYQYTQAVNAANGDQTQVDITRFQYPGPTPHSRETAILMLADGCEAITRARPPHNEEELRALVNTIITNRQKEGQLDKVELTLQDLSLIQNSFVATLRGIYHPRIAYPVMKTPQAEHTADQAAPKLTSVPAKDPTSTTQ
ncbi:MAG: HDIG domain-containing protein [Anaerolineales bacterium]